ncbi:MAG: hypothetical protein AB1938_12900 [Myxococcota bacterium]
MRLLFPALALLLSGCSHVRSSVYLAREKPSAEVRLLADLPPPDTYEVLALIEPKHALPLHVFVDLTREEAQRVGANALVVFSQRRLVAGPGADDVFLRTTARVALSLAANVVLQPELGTYVIGPDTVQPGDSHEVESVWAKALFVPARPPPAPDPTPSTLPMGGPLCSEEDVREMAQAGLSTAAVTRACNP